MKFYKAMYNGICLNQKYKERRIYEVKFKNEKSEIKPNVVGLHFYDNPVETVYDYDIYKQSYELYEVEPLGNIKSINGCYVTDILRIIRKVPLVRQYCKNIPKIFGKSYFELVGISRVYVWDNKCYRRTDDIIEEVIEINYLHRRRVRKKIKSKRIKSRRQK